MRKKSINDIYRQVDRIYSNPRVTQERIDRAEAAAEGYEQNILDQNGNRRKYVAAAQKLAGGDMSAKRTIRRIEGRRYSASTYRDGEMAMAMSVG